MEIITDDDSFGGSNEECRTINETFIGNKTGGPVANNKPQSGKRISTNVTTSSEHAPLLTVKEVILNDSSNACGSSKSKGSNARGSSKSKSSNARGSSECKSSKCMKSSVSQEVNEKNSLENALNPLVVQIESASTVLHPSSDSSSLQDTFRVLKYSVISGPSSSNISTAAAKPCINISGDNDHQPNMVLNPDYSGCKDSEAIKQVTSPTSQESSGSKAVLTNDVSNSRSSNIESQTDNKLSGDVSLSDTRDQLFDAVTRLMEAKGWHIEVLRRSCRGYNEKNYISDKGKRVREFSKFWRLLGRSLSVNDSPGVDEHTYKGWPDMGHYIKDLSLTLARTDLTISPTGTDSELARIWNILDPFVELMFIRRELVSLRRATDIPAFRSIPFNAFVTNSGDLTFDKLDAVSKKKPKNKRKIQPSDSSLATDNANQNENAGCGRITSFGKMLREGSNPQKSKKGRRGCKLTSRLADNGKIKNAGQRGDAEAIVFEKVTGMEGSLFRSSLYDVHTDLIKEWGSQNVPTELAKTVDDMPTNNLENHIAAETVVLRYANNKDAPFDFSGHKMLQPSGVSLVENEFIYSSNVPPGKDPSVGFIMLKGSMKEPEIYLNLLHNVSVIWTYQEDLTCSKKTVAEVDIVTAVLDSTFTGAVNEGISFGSSKHIGGLMDDDDMLLSAIKKRTRKRGRPAKSGSTSNLKVCNVKRRAKGRGRGRKLHPRSGGKGENQVENEKCITSGTRTPLSWLIDSGVVHVDDSILYRKPQSNDVVKNGFLTKDGILCYCCHEVYSVPKFRLHADANSPEAFPNLFMECGKPYSLCQLIGWSAEYSKRINHKKATCVEDEDESDDICGLCGDGGNLVCCDNCPATFHQKCLSVKKIPDGDWYCFSCICHICGEFSRGGSTERLKCAQCEQKYHANCLLDRNIIPEVNDDWFCSELCHKVHSDIRSRVGAVVPLAKGYSSTLLRCLHEVNEKAYSQTPNATGAECNTKLAVALTIMEECFLSMVDFRTGIDMIPHMVYNFGSKFPRLDFHGFYTVVLEKDDVLICVATLRIHGSSIAEIPLVATCNKYRRQGMCRLLMGGIEETLKALKIEKIVMSAVPELVPTWVNAFGFQPVEDEENSSLKTLNLVVFPGTVLLQKSLLQAGPIEQTTHASAENNYISKPVPGTNALQHSDWHPMTSEDDTIDPGSNVVY